MKRPPPALEAALAQLEAAQLRRARVTTSIPPVLPGSARSAAV